MKTYPIRSDKRWTITREFTGKPTRQHVIRFCGEWVDSRPSHGEAVFRAIDANCARINSLQPQTQNQP